MKLNDEQEAAFRAAAARTSYRLTFGKTPEPRQIHSDEMEGPDLPDALSEDAVQPGGWGHLPSFAVNGKCLGGASEPDWLAHFLSMAVGEAVHEALEAFHVDGQRYLNPHGRNEEYIYILVNELSANLAEIAEGERSGENVEFDREADS